MGCYWKTGSSLCLSFTAYERAVSHSFVNWSIPNSLNLATKKGNINLQFRQGFSCLADVSLFSPSFGNIIPFSDRTISSTVLRRNDTILSFLCLWQSCHMNVEGHCELGTSTILDKYMLHEENYSGACRAGFGQACCPWDMKPPCRCGPVHQPTSDLSASKQQPVSGCAAAWGAEHLLATKTQKIPVPSKGFPIWDLGLDHLYRTA